MAKINIADLDKAAVLAALYNNARIQGTGILHPEGSMPMSIEQARTLLGTRDQFDYVNGRVLKVDLRGEEFDPWLYNRDNGEGKAERVVEHLRKTGSIEEII